MEHKHNHIPSKSKAIEQDWHALPFDAATNFSLLGWFLDKFIQGHKTEETVDLKLEE